MKKIVDKIDVVLQKKQKLEKYSIKKSLMSRMMCFVVVVVLVIIAIGWLLNKLLFPNYYEDYKVKQIASMYEDINKATFTTQQELANIDNKLSNEMINYFDDGTKLSDCLNKVKNYAFEVYIFEPSYQDNIQNIDRMYVINGDKNKTRDEIWKSRNIYNLLASTHSNEYHGSDYDILLKKKDKRDDYNILKYKAQEDSSAKLLLIGKISSIKDANVRVILKADYANISENIHISNRFLAIIGMVMAVIACIMMFYMMKRIIRPILNLSHISERMANLDFDAKYEDETEDEVGELGKSMNFLSGQLKEKISELKLANIELQNDIEKKMKSDNMRREFLSNISHELKTPIALVQGYAEGLKENINDDAESRDFYCDVIIDESKKMNNMVKKMLDLNHLEFGDASLTIERFDIVALIRGILSSTEILFKKKDAKVIFVEEDPEYVWADEFMIEEVITNYLSNALNHLDGNRIVEIKLIKREDTVRVAVFNTGKNIPQEDIDRIWEKFYKVDKARTREYGGSGVGLSIVKIIIELHNKTCGVVNRDRGVEFWFELDTKDKI